MEILRATDYQVLSNMAAEIVAREVNSKPDCVLGLATGSTPIGLYKQLAQLHNTGKLSLSRIYGINLDEYVGLSAEHKLSYQHYMWYNFYNLIKADARHVNIPNGLAEDLKKECERYDAVIKSLGGIDLQILGIGANGHIGFNEPAEVFIKNTHVVQLHESTRKMNARFFDNMNQVPTSAITIGIGAIMRAKKILLLASGHDKSTALHKMLHSDITPQIPATILQLHSNVTIIADEESLG